MTQPLQNTRARRAPRVRRVATAVVGALLAATTALTLTPGAANAVPGGNPVTPGDFTGYGFDQCLAPSQSAMNTWMQSSPFLAVGIYIAGDSRACRSQPNLTPAWVTTQLRQGWRLLPITLGPQASCQPRFPRYSDDVKINPKQAKNGRFFQAKRQGTAEADATITAARALGIAPGSTLWYDIEGYDTSITACRESALSFLSSWTERLRARGYVSGVYSSAGSGIAALDNARADRPGLYTMPDRIWMARWDGVANTSTSYVREDGWRPRGRIKQYVGGHDETWGGVRINIDRNFLDLGEGSVPPPTEKHCNGVRLSYATYPFLAPAAAGSSAPVASRVKVLQCLLKEKKVYGGQVNGRLNTRTLAAVHTWQQKVSHPVRDRWSSSDWVSLLADGARPASKYGSASTSVRRLQRALNAASPKTHLVADGVLRAATDAALRTYQTKRHLSVTGVAGYPTWAALQRGLR